MLVMHDQSCLLPLVTAAAYILHMCLLFVMAAALEHVHCSTLLLFAIFPAYVTVLPLVVLWLLPLHSIHAWAGLDCPLSLEMHAVHGLGLCPVALSGVSMHVCDV